MNLIITTSIEHIEGIIDVTRVNLTNRIMTFFFSIEEESYLSQKNSMTDESIRFRVFFVLCIYIDVFYT